MAIDFFAGEAAADAALQGSRVGHQPRARTAFGAQRYQGVTHRRLQRTLRATRRAAWVDRLACAWLIRRFVDPQGPFRLAGDAARTHRAA